MTPDPRPLVPLVRGYTPGPPPERRRHSDWRPGTLLVLDAETELSEAQSLLFLSYRLVRVRWDGDEPALRCVEEGLVYTDELPERRPAEHAILAAYVRDHAPAVAHEELDAAYRLALRPRRDFVDQVLRPAAGEREGLRAWVTTFHGAYDLTRLMAPHLPASPEAWLARPGFAVGAGGERTRRRRPSAFAGGYSLPIWEHEQPEGSGVWRESSRFRPRLGIKHRGARHDLAGWIGGPGRGDFHGAFLDTLTAGAALTGEGHDLEGMCEAFGFRYQEELDRLGLGAVTKRTVEHGAITPDYIGYNRADVAATTRLAEAILREARALRIATPPTLFASSASIAKDTLDRLGVRPLLARQPDFDPQAMGDAMQAMFGGRTECHIRRTVVPITYLDYVSQYPTVSILLGLQDYLTCARVDVVDEDPEAVGARLAALGLDAILDPSVWPSLRGIALVDPADAILPVRGDWHATGEATVALNRIAESAEPRWYAYPDLVGSRLLTGRVPRVLAARRFVPVGQAGGLRAAHFGATLRIDLRRDNLYRSLIEARARIDKADALSPEERRRVGQFLKIVANSLFGITAEVNPRPTVGPPADQEVHGARSFTVPTNELEEPGAFFFGVQAALTTAGGRLLLAILERLVTDAGGTWCFADTDSFAVVSSATGGDVACPTDDGRDRITAVSWDRVDAIRGRVNALNPYDRSVIPYLLKVEKVNHRKSDPRQPRRALWGYSVAAKKYVLFEAADGPPQPDGLPPTPWTIADRREHGLGYLRNPLDPRRSPQGRDWVTEAWAWVLGTERGERPPEPAWIGLPKMSANATLSTPRLLRAFARRNEAQLVADAIKPFNFLNRVFLDPDELPAGLRDLALAAPHEADPGRWLEAEYFNVHEADGRAYRITTRKPDPEVGDDGSGRIVVGTYGDVVRDLPRHRESKSLGPDGRVCGPETRGLLGRRTVTLAPARHARKESSTEPDDALVGRWARTRVWEDELPTEPEPDSWAEAWRPRLREWPVGTLARALGVDERTVKRWRAGMRPHRRMEARIVAWLSAPKQPEHPNAAARRRRAERGRTGVRGGARAGGPAGR